MKFDLIISNPPYNSGLDLKILESVNFISEKICFVHPMTWLFDQKGSKRYNRIKETFKNQLVSVEHWSYY